MSLSREEASQVLVDCILSVAPEADMNDLRPDRSLRDQLEIDSFDFLTLLTHLHEKTGINVPEADYGKLVTLNNMIDYFVAASGRVSPS